MIEPRILELAERLGQALAEADRVKKYRELHAEVAADRQAQDLARALHEQEQAIARKQQDNQPIEVAEKHRLRDLREQIYDNEKLKALMAAEADFLELFQQVNELIGRHILPVEPGEGPSQPTAGPPAPPSGPPAGP